VEDSLSNLEAKNWNSFRTIVSEFVVEFSVSAKRSNDASRDSEIGAGCVYFEQPMFRGAGSKRAVPTRQGLRTRQINVRYSG
jgi:hypothetical protein